jgi:pimeloyl-ACP methyl ester carboxylesterase
MRRLSNRAWILLMLAICLAVTASAAGFVLSRPGAQAAAAPGSGSAAPASPGSAQARADLGRMQSLLNTGSVQAQSALLVPPLKFAPGSGPVFPAGTAVTIRPGTLRSDGQFGTVQADLSGGKAATLGLYSVQGHWRLYHVAAGSAQTTAKVTAHPGGPVTAQLLSSVKRNACPAPETVGTRVPVILIHGYTGSPKEWGSDYDTASMFFKIDMMHGTYVSAFDYSQDSTNWVTDQAIGPDFASYIHCVAQASGATHGPGKVHGFGKVIVVAHSMGGLATRYAANYGDTEDGITAKMVTDDLAAVITIGTPNTGTQLASIGDIGRSPLLCGTSQFKLAWTDTKWCQDFRALAGMSAFGGQITALPELPSSIPLHAIAGDETVLHPLGSAITILPLLGDGLVLTSSALHALPQWSQSVATVSCTTLANPLGPCWHGALPRNLEVEQKVYDIIHVYVQAYRPPAPAAPALGGDAYWLAGGGKWYHHGMGFQISRGPLGLTGTEYWNEYGTIVNGQIHLAFTSNADGSLTGTYTTSATYTYVQGGPADYPDVPNPDPSSPQKGQVITLMPVGPHYAKKVEPVGWAGLCQEGMAHPWDYCGA